MKNKPLIIFLLFFNLTIFAQQINLDKNIDKLNKEIYLLESNELPQKIHYSLPQTTAHYFKLVTETQKDLISELENKVEINELLKKYPNLIVDFDLLVIRNKKTNYKKEQEIEFKSFEIGNNKGHGFTKKFNDSLVKNDLKFIYKTYKANKYRKKTFIIGFILKAKFKEYKTSKKYNAYVNYTDKIINPKFNLFHNPHRSSYSSYEFIPEFSSLTNYYNDVTRKPKHNKSGDYLSHLNSIREWKDKKYFFADSLFIYDNLFKNKLIKAYNYALKNNVSNRDLEFFVGQLISKTKALYLMRNNPQKGTCSFDNSPRVQLAEMVRLSSEIPNWNIFIKSSMNLLNDYASRNANSNIASQRRKTYINELEKLNLNINKLLIGSSIRVNNTETGHYFSSGAKIGQAFASASNTNQIKFENEITRLIKDKNIDPFNKLHFYNTLGHYKYHIKDSLKQISINQMVLDLMEHLPNEIVTRIKEPNLELKNLLIREKEQLDNYEILNSIVSSILTTDFSGNCWDIDLKDKKGNEKISYSLTMSLEDSITPLSNFTNKKEDMLSRIKNHKFLMRMLAEDQEVEEIVLRFVNNSSLNDYNRWLSDDFPKKLLKNISFEEDLLIYTKMKKGRSLKWILTKNDILILLEIPKDLNLLNFSFKELVTIEKKGFMNSKTYYSYRGINSKGKIVF